LTYNVHRCLGCDGVLAPERIAQVIARYEPDVVALQELDVGHARTGHADQPELLARYLDMHYYFHPAIEAADERYGDAILSRYPMHLVRAGHLPTLGHWPGHERRGALWVALSCPGGALQLLNTHLGLGHRERLAQVEALLGPEWLAHPDCTRPLILCGDFNAWPASRVYRQLRQVLHEAQDQDGFRRPRGTYPSRCPFLRIDYVFHSPDVTVRRVQVPRTRLTRMASDHLPLVVEVSLP
jgi:endonuclease/exonuclease/phosphatase family metal-dependent hydrolase